MKLSMTNMFLLTLLSILLMVGPAIAKGHPYCKERCKQEGKTECRQTDQIWGCKKGYWYM